MATVPVTILAGCARSGKSSFLAKLQRCALLGRTAVVGKQLSGHPHDLAQLLHQMKLEREQGLIDFERVVVECDGDVSPARPALGLFVDEAVAVYYRLDAIVTIVDALHGINQLASRDAALKQVVFADRLLVSKADLVEKEQLLTLHQHLGNLNPRAPIQNVCPGRADLVQVFNTGAFDLGTMLALEPQFFHLPSQPRKVSAMPLSQAGQQHYNPYAQADQQHLRH